MLHVVGHLQVSYLLPGASTFTTLQDQSRSSQLHGTSVFGKHIAQQSLSTDSNSVQQQLFKVTAAQYVKDETRSLAERLLPSLFLIDTLIVQPQAVIILLPLPLTQPSPPAAAPSYLEGISTAWLAVAAAGGAAPYITCYRCRGLVAAKRASCAAVMYSTGVRGCSHPSRARQSCCSCLWASRREVESRQRRDDERPCTARTMPAAAKQRHARFGTRV